MAPEMFYKMRDGQRGRCLIFHFGQQHFHKARDKLLCLPSNTAKEDVDLLVQTFKRLRFQVLVHNDLTYEATQQVLENESMHEHSNSDCLVVCIVANGGKDSFYIYNNLAKRKFPIEKLLNYFAGSSCPSLVGKPKLFLIQSNRGQKVDDGFLVPDSLDRARSRASFRVPNYADLMVLYSSFCRFRSYTEPEGSWFIRSVCNVLNENWHQLDLNTMVTMILNQVASMGDGQCAKQMPCLVSTLTRLVHFNRGALL